MSNEILVSPRTYVDLVKDQNRQLKEDLEIQKAKYDILLEKYNNLVYWIEKAAREI